MKLTARALMFDIFTGIVGGLILSAAFVFGAR